MKDLLPTHLVSVRGPRLRVVFDLFRGLVRPLLRWHTTKVGQSEEIYAKKQVIRSCMHKNAALTPQVYISLLTPRADMIIQKGKNWDVFSMIFDQY